MLAIYSIYTTLKFILPEIRKVKGCWTIDSNHNRRDIYVFCTYFTRTHFNILDGILQKFNSTKHQSIKMTPAENIKRNMNTKFVWNSRKKKTNFRVGNKVRITCMIHNQRLSLTFYRWRNPRSLNFRGIMKNCTLLKSSHESELKMMLKRYMSNGLSTPRQTTHK